MSTAQLRVAIPRADDVVVLQLTTPASRLPEYRPAFEESLKTLAVDDAAPFRAEECSAVAPTPRQVKWLRKNAIAFETAEAGNGFDDLKGLREIIGDARIVALGEATHGTREFFLMKHRLVEFLARETGFTVFSIEANMPEAYRVDDCVSRGEGDPAKSLAGMCFWTWNTEEVPGMIRWMHAFNKAGPKHMRFTGFDMQTPRVAMEIEVKFLEDAGLWWRAAGPPGSTNWRFESRRGDHAKKTSGEEEDWAIQNARIVHQWRQMNDCTVSRDESMARNVRWILDHSPPKTKIVLWAHNGHVNRTLESMGGHLDPWYGKEMVIVGFTTHAGRYTAFGSGGVTSDHKVKPSEPGSLEYALHKTGLPRLILDLRKTSERSGGASWLTRSMPFRYIGSEATEDQFLRTNVRRAFDVIIYFDETTATKCFVHGRAGKGEPKDK